MEPVKLKRSYKDYIWGGERLKTDYGKTTDMTPLAESWELSVHSDGEARTSDGIPLSLALTKERMGTNAARHALFPVLTKFIDAKADLSVQVHPSDEYALKNEGSLGKTEMWYIIDAQPDAYIYAGFKEELSSEQYEQKVADGTIMEALAKHSVHTGDVFYIPAGRVHAIGKGVLLAEVQQSSDVTYRIYDYDRMGLDGKPRELHTHLAAQALDFKVYPEYRNSYKDVIDTANACLDTEHFTVRVVSIKEPIHRNMIKYDSFIIHTCTKGQCKIRIRSTHDEITLQEGYSSLIPAAIADYDIIPINGEVKVLESYINNSTQSTFRRMISQFLHMSNI